MSKVIPSYWGYNQHLTGNKACSHRHGGSWHNFLSIGVDTDFKESDKWNLREDECQLQKEEEPLMISFGCQCIKALNSFMEEQGAAVFLKDQRKKNPVERHIFHPLLVSKASGIPN